MGIIWLFLILNTSSQTSEDWGQAQVRQDWIEARNRPEAYQNFKKTRFFKGIAEDEWDLWSGAILPKNLIDLSQNPRISAYQVRRLVSDHPFAASLWVPALSHSFEMMVARPFEALHEMEEILDLLLPPLLFAFLLTFFFYLHLWAPALLSGLPPYLQTRSPVLLSLFFLIGLYFAVRDQLWLWIVFLCLSIGLSYSRKIFFFSITAITTAALISSSPFLVLALHTAEDLDALEALSKGRTKIEYRPEALANLPPLESAIWAELNGDSSLAKNWLEKVPHSLERDIVSLNLEYDPARTEEIFHRYQKLLEVDSNNSIILFNLNQLSILQQNLIQADEYRHRISDAKYEELSERATSLQRPLIFPTTQNLIEVFKNRFHLKSAALLQDLKARSFSSLLYFFLPWFFLLFFYRQRKKAEGICSMTGLTTPSPEQEILPQASQSNRHQIDFLSRNFARTQKRRLQTWGWIFPGARELLYDFSFENAFLKTFFVFFLAWLAISEQSRALLLSAFDVISVPSIGPSTFSLPILAIALLVYAFDLSHIRKSSRS